MAVRDWERRLWAREWRECGKPEVGSTDPGQVGSRDPRSSGSTAPNRWVCDLCLISVHVCSVCPECGIDSAGSFLREVDREKASERE